MNIPYNLSAEKEVLSSILQKNDIFYEVSEHIKTEDFYDTKHQLLYSLISNLLTNNKQATINSLVMELGENIKSIPISYIADIATESITTTTAVTNAKIVKQLSRRRKVITECKRLLQGATDTKKDISTLLGQFENNTTFEEEKNNIWSMEEVAAATLEEVEKNYKNGGKIVGMETGLTQLDIALNGFRKGDVYIIAGRPSMGKTVLALNIAERLGRKHNVYYASLEMYKEKLGTRLLSARSKINSLSLGMGRIKDKEWEEVAITSSQLAINHLHIDDSPTLSMLDIKARCKKLKKTSGLDVVVIDHLGLLKPHTKRESRQLEVGDMSRMGKILAKELDVAVIFLMQLNRSPEGRQNNRPVLSDLGESGKIEQDADTVLMLYRDEYYKEKSENRGVMEVLVRKNRDGQLGTLKLAYLEQYQLISNLDLVH